MQPLFFSVNVPVAPLYEKADAKSQMVSQALFGEMIIRHGISGKFCKVVTPDNYIGWMLTAHSIGRVVPYEGVKVMMLFLPIYPTKDIHRAPEMTVSYGSILKLNTDFSDENVDQVKLPNNALMYVRKGSLDEGNSGVKPAISDLPSYCQQFLGIPYVWGGRSSFGYDCSGFVQMLYDASGISLPRDAEDQVKSKKLSFIEPENHKPGDLVFFENYEGRIVHVGMSMGDSRIIHASTNMLKPVIEIAPIQEVIERGNYQGVHYRTTSYLQVEALKSQSLASGL